MDGIWNLVLACTVCNRGVNGKFDKIPVKLLLERLHPRNEFLISSHHPLRETLMQQTGKTEQHRKTFLIDFYEEAWNKNDPYDGSKGILQFWYFLQPWPIS